MDIRKLNRKAWDKKVEDGSQWTQPVNTEVVNRARRGDWAIFLTPSQPVPVAWFPPLEGLDVLCLASGGGQQGPVLAAAGANVTVLDNSPRQLAQDQLVAARDGLSITTIEGDMTHMPMLADAGFDLIVHPVSNLFVPDVRPLWQETFRVLKPGGHLLAGFVNPAFYLVDHELAAETGKLEIKYALPYSDLAQLSEAEMQQRIAAKESFEFGHLLDDQIGGQLAAGFLLTGFYEDNWASPDDNPMMPYMPCFLATRAQKAK